MSDPLSMSLDDIIKQRKKNNPSKPRGSVNKARLSGRPKYKIGNSPAARVSRQYRGRLTNSILTPTKAMQSPRGRNLGRYFRNSQPQTPNWTSRKPKFVPPRQNGRRNRRIPQYSRPEYQYEAVLPRRQRFPPSRSINSVQKFNWQGKLKFAKKSVNKARQILVRRRVMMNAKPMRNSGRNGRIRVGRFGLLTTQRQDVLQRQALMQQKIQRARQAREHSQVDNLVFYNARGRRQQNRMIQDTEPLFPRSMGPARRSPRADDNWVPPLRTVRNAGVSVQAARSGLDPVIQRKIKYIQAQGRRSRGESRRAVSPAYEAEDIDFLQPTIITSRMSLSERFKRFMN